jgi:hypothetical protein
MIVTITCVVLLSMSLATADVWREQMTGTIGSYSPVSRTVVIEAPRDGDGREIREAPSMSLLRFISGAMVGVLLGLLLSYRVLRGWPFHKRSQCDMDQLVEQFQALFREIDQGKHRHP